jgi:exopolyphosphatase/pppGpp-phosphohydrolase
LEVLPTAAVLLDHVVRHLKCKEVRFSAFGLREGHVYDQLSPDEQSRDPLLAACAEIARRDARFDHMGDPLMAWTVEGRPGLLFVLQHPQAPVQVLFLEGVELVTEVGEGILTHHASIRPGNWHPP